MKGWKRAGVIVALLMGAFALWVATAELPSVLVPGQRALVIRDARGGVLREPPFEDGLRAQWISLEQVPRAALDAIVQSEDHHLGAHPGIDPLGIARAAWLDATHRRIVAGGSTLAMQLARMSYGLPRTYLGKLEQVLLGVMLQMRLGTLGVLEAYVNLVPLGRDVRGLAMASQAYLGKPLRDATTGEAVALACLVRAPTAYDPHRHSARLLARRHHVLRLMLARGTLSLEDMEAANQEPLRLTRFQRTFRAPHASALAYLEAERRGGRAPTEINTSLDPSLQRMAQRACKDAVRDLADSAATDCAAVILRASTSEVLALVGSPDFHSPHGGQVNAAVAPRQPGSALKPFLYALAFERGRSPGDLIRDESTEFPGAFGEWVPENYDRRFHGEVTLREALANSYNIPAAKLVLELGVDSLLARLRSLGFATLTEQGIALRTWSGTRGWRSHAARPGGCLWSARPRRLLSRTHVVAHCQAWLGDARSGRAERSPRVLVGSELHGGPRASGPCRAPSGFWRRKCARVALRHGGQDRHFVALPGQLGGGLCGRHGGRRLGRTPRRCAHARRVWGLGSWTGLSSADARGRGSRRRAFPCSARGRRLAPFRQAHGSGADFHQTVSRGYARAPMQPPHDIGPLCVVTGGSGFVGRALVKRLLDQGYQVRVFDRAGHAELDARAELVLGDVRDPVQVRNALVGAGTVFHTASLIHLAGIASKETRKLVFGVNVTGTQNVIDGCLASGVRQLVHTSTNNVVFDREIVDGDESAPYVTRWVDLYTQTKMISEKAVLAQGKRGPLRTCALRPGGIWAPHGGGVMIDRVLDQLALGTFVARIGSGRTRGQHARGEPVRRPTPGCTRTSGKAGVGEWRGLFHHGRRADGSRGLVRSPGRRTGISTSGLPVAGRLDVPPRVRL